MANWMNQDGDWYVAKHGYDTINLWNAALAGTSVDETNIGSINYPFRTLGMLHSTAQPTTPRANGQKVVIGPGRWTDDVYIATKSFYFKYFGESGCFFDGDMSPYEFKAGFGDEVFNGIIFDYRLKVNNLVYNAWNAPSNTISFRNCTIKNAGLLCAVVINMNLYDCHCENVDFNCNNESLKIRLENCNLVNCICSGGRPFRNGAINCHFDSNDFKFSYSSTGVFDYCNIIGTITYGYNQYNLAAWQNIGYNLNSHNYTNPMFNRPEIGDYTLAPGSPLLWKGRNNAHIGAFGMAHFFNANSTEFVNGTLSNVVSKQIEINGQLQHYWQLASGQTSGSIESATIQLTDIATIDVPHLMANLVYDEIGNAVKLADETDANPATVMLGKVVQYDFKMKWSTVSEADLNAQSYKQFIWNTALTVDNAGLGNADDSFVVSEATQISARYLKIKITLKEV